MYPMPAAPPASTPRPRRWRWKLAVATLAVWAFLVGAAGLTLDQVFVRGYERVEREIAVRDLARAGEAVRTRLAAQERLAADWAVWDDTWNFARSWNSAFIDDNLGDETFRELAVELVAVFRADGTLAVARGFDLAEGHAVPPRPGLLAAMARQGALFRPRAARSGISGLVVAPGGPWLVSSRPIVQSDGTGPSAGVLVFARRLDGRELASLESLTHLRLSLVAIDDVRAEGLLARRTLAAGRSVADIDRRTLAAWSELSDLDGAPAVLLQVESPRVLGTGARAVCTRLGAAFSAFIAFIALAVAMLIDRLRQLADLEGQQLLSDFVASATEAIALVSMPDRTIVSANAALSRLVGVPSEQLVGRRLENLLGQERARIVGLVERAERAASATPEEFNFILANGQTAAIELVCSRIAAGDRLCVFARDVTERRRLAEQTRHVAYHDAVTGLPNRALFRERLQEALDDAARDGRPCAVAFLDLDHFKELNDTLGHDAADRVLAQVAERISLALREGELVARQGGDEFLVLLPLAGAEGAGPAAERILAAVRQPLTHDGRAVQIQGSLGLAIFPQHGGDMETLVRHADMAMYQAKGAGRAQWKVFETAMGERAKRTATLRARLSRAIDGEEFALHFQPQADLHTGMVVAAEALVRWQSVDGEAASADFIPFAEEVGFTVPLGEMILHRACVAARRWQDAGFAPVRVAVNLSARQFGNAGMVDLVRRALLHSRLAPSYLELEVTESSAMRSPEATRRLIEELRGIGVGVALDDFGTGYSSLGYLRQFPFDRVKIDRSFLAGVATSEDGRTLVASIIRLAHALKLEVIAEGVEDAEQLACLAADGCDFVQGFGIGRPMPEEAFAALLARGERLFDPRVLAFTPRSGRPPG
jgi:diguanylate cyclase (GGDEF)-like protein/PAS domain S-box-containing protein